MGKKQIHVAVTCSRGCGQVARFYLDDATGFENILFSKGWKNIQGHWLCQGCMRDLLAYETKQEKDRLAFLNGKTGGDTSGK